MTKALCPRNSYAYFIDGKVQRQSQAVVEVEDSLVRNGVLSCEKMWHLGHSGDRKGMIKLKHPKPSRKPV